MKKRKTLAIIIIIAILLWFIGAILNIMFMDDIIGYFGRNVCDGIFLISLFWPVIIGLCFIVYYIFINY